MLFITVKKALKRFRKVMVVLNLEYFSLVGIRSTIYTLFSHCLVRIRIAEIGTYKGMYLYI